MRNLLGWLPIIVVAGVLNYFIYKVFKVVNAEAKVRQLARDKENAEKRAALPILDEEIDAMWKEYKKLK